MTSTFQARLTTLGQQEPSYEEYCAALHAAAYNQQTAGIATDLLLKAKSWLVELKAAVSLPVKDILTAMSAKPVYALLKSIRFNLSAILKGMKEALALVRKGLLKVFAELAKTDAVRNLRKGAKLADEFLAAHPILTRVTGAVLAGLLLYMWLTMSFTGDIDSDFDVAHIGQALLGHFSLQDFFSDTGLLDLFLFTVGLTTGLSFPWLATSLGNLLVAVVYSGFRYLKNKPAMNELHSELKRGGV